MASQYNNKLRSLVAVSIVLSVRSIRWVCFLQVMNNGNVTTGSIVFRPTRHDDGRHIRCRATNPTIQHAVIEDTVMLSVRCEYHCSRSHAWQGFIVLITLA